MRLGHVLTLHRIVVLALFAGLAIAGADSTQARPHRPQKAEKQQTAEKKHARPVHGSWYKPPYAAFVIDDKSGQVLHEENPDEPRHPASLTKVMTLYLLFEQLEYFRVVNLPELIIRDIGKVPRHQVFIVLQPRGVV